MELDQLVEDAMIEYVQEEGVEYYFDEYFSFLLEHYETRITMKVGDCILRLKEKIEMYPILARVINEQGKPLIVTVCEEWSGEFDDDYEYNNRTDAGFFGNVDAIREAARFLFQCNPFVFQNSMEIKDSENQTYLHVLCEILTNDSDSEVIGEAICSIVENHNPSSLMLCDSERKTPLFVLCEKLHHWIDDEGRDAADSCSQLLVLISTMMQRCPESTRVMSMEGSRALDKLMPHSTVPAVQDLIIFMNRCLYPLLPFVSDGFTTEVQSSLKEEARHSKIGTRLMAMKSILSKRTALSEADESSPTPEPADEVCEVLGDWAQLQLSKIDQKIKTIQDVDIPRIKKKYAA